MWDDVSLYHRFTDRAMTVSLRSMLVGVLMGAAIGFVGLLAVRLAALPPLPQPPHYHANWAMYVNGQRVDLTASRYMEDIGACSMGPGVVQPRERVHMHLNNHDVVHVHDDGVTWGHFMANLGYAVGSDFLIMDNGTAYFDSEERTLDFIVNGRAVDDIANQLIGNRDRVLISYGPETTEQVLEEQFPAVASDAEAFNATFDPMGCSGAAVEEDFWGKLRRAVWFPPSEHAAGGH